MLSRIGNFSPKLPQILANLVSWVSASLAGKSYSRVDRSEKYDNDIRCNQSILEHSNTDSDGDRDLFGSSQPGSERALLENLLTHLRIENPNGNAHKILHEFGSIPKFFDTSDRRLKKLGLESTPLKNQIYLIKESLKHYLKPTEFNQTKLHSFSELINYLIFQHGYLNFEQVRVLFFDDNNFLISDQLVSSGTPNQSAIYTRNIIHQALDIGACGIVLVHNHPSGAALMPSRQDIAVTKEICDGCRHLGIAVFDHLIMSKSDYYSFQQNGLM